MAESSWTIDQHGSTVDLQQLPHSTQGHAPNGLVYDTCDAFAQGAIQGISCRLLNMAVLLDIANAAAQHGACDKAETVVFLYDRERFRAAAQLLWEHLWHGLLFPHKRA